VLGGLDASVASLHGVEVGNHFGTLTALLRKGHSSTICARTYAGGVRVGIANCANGVATTLTLTPTLTFASVASAEALNLYALNLSNEEVESGAGGGELGEVGFVVFHTLRIPRFWPRVKGFGPVVTLVHTARAGSTPVLL
jgi:hypothetical protein